MAKYIDADRLRTEIEILIEKYSSVEAKGVLQEGYKGGRLIGYRDTINKLNSLQQEQPEVDLEKEIKNERSILLDLFGPMNGEQSLAISNLARHFYELGLNARKEE